MTPRERLAARVRSRGDSGATRLSAEAVRLLALAVEHAGEDGTTGDRLGNNEALQRRLRVGERTFTRACEELAVLDLLRWEQSGSRPTEWRPQFARVREWVAGELEERALGGSLPPSDAGASHPQDGGTNGVTPPGSEGATRARASTVVSESDRQRFEAYKTALKSGAIRMPPTNWPRLWEWVAEGLTLAQVQHVAAELGAGAAAHCHWRQADAMFGEMARRAAQYGMPLSDYDPVLHAAWGIVSAGGVVLDLSDYRPAGGGAG